MRLKILPLFFLLHCWIFTFGQTEKGGWLIDAEIEVNPFSGFPVFQLNVNSLACYFIEDNFLLGTEIGFIYQQTQFVILDKNTDYFATPFVRYYFLKGKFRPYAQADYTFDWKRRTVRGSSSGMGSIRALNYETAFKTAASISFGANYFLNNNIALDVRFQFFLHDKREDRNQRQNSKFRGFKFGLNYFFNQQNQFQNDTLAPLVTRYLKKGSFSIGLNGQTTFISFKRGGNQGTIEWSIFLLDKFRLNNKFIPLISWGGNLFDYFTYWGYQPDIQLFIPLNSSVFITTSIGGDMGLFHTKVPRRTRTEAFGWSFLGKSSLAHFRKNSILEFGAEFRYFLRDRSRIESNRWDSDLFLKFTQFLTAQWNVELEVRTNLFGLSKREVFGDQNREAPEFLRFGFQYFIEK